MSHYTEITTEFRDLECLLKALNDLGVTDIRQHETPQWLKGYSGDLREQKANVIVPRGEVNAKLSGGASNDLGFVKEDGRYNAVVSVYDQHRWWNAKSGTLTQRYNYHKIKKEARRHGKRVTETKLPDGTVKLTLAV